MDILETWNKDPEFKGLPESEKQKIYTNYFDRELADEEFAQLPNSEQFRIKKNFLGKQGVEIETVIPTTITQIPKMDKSHFGLESAIDVPLEDSGFDAEPSPEIKPEPSETIEPDKPISQEEQLKATLQATNMLMGGLQVAEETIPNREALEVDNMGIDVIPEDLTSPIKAIGEAIPHDLPAGIGALQGPAELFFKDIEPFFMTPEEEQAMQAKHPNLMAARYAAASVLAPGIMEKVVSPTELEEFKKKPTEQQKEDILGLAASYAAFGGAAHGAKALAMAAAKRFPWLTKPMGKFITDTEWFKKADIKIRGRTAQGLDKIIKRMEASGASEADILKALRKHGKTKEAYERFAKSQGINPDRPFRMLPEQTPREQVKSALDQARSEAAAKLDGTFKPRQIAETKKIPYEPKAKPSGPTIRPQYNEPSGPVIKMGEKPVSEVAKTKKVAGTKPDEAVKPKIAVKKPTPPKPKGKEAWEMTPEEYKAAGLGSSNDVDAMDAMEKGLRVNAQIIDEYGVSVPDNYKRSADGDWFEAKKLPPSPEKTDVALEGKGEVTVPFRKKAIFDKADFKPPEKKVSYKTEHELEEWVGDEIYEQAMRSWEDHGIYQFLSRFREKPKDIIQELGKGVDDFVKQDALERVSKGDKVEDFPERLLKEITNTGAARKYVEEWIRKYYPDVNKLADFEDVLFEAHTGAAEMSEWWDDFVKNPKKYLGMIDEKTPTLADKAIGKKPPEEIKITGKKDKTVSVEMPEKKAEGLSPKEQKGYLLAEIDKAIGTASDGIPESASKLVKWEQKSPDKVKKHRKKSEEVYSKNVEKFGTVTIEVPGDGEFTILNTKDSLKRFKKSAGSFPVNVPKAKEIKGASTKPTGKRITGIEGQYYNEFKSRKEGILEKAPDPDTKKISQYYKDGLFTNGNYIIKTDSKPKLKHKVETKNTPDMDELLKNHDEAKPAEIRGETNDYEKDIVKVHVETKDGKHYLYNAIYFDSVLTKYPNAKLKVGNDGTAFFVEKDSAVGMVMPFRSETKSQGIAGLSDYAEERYNQIYAKPKPEGKKLKEVGKKPKTFASVGEPSPPVQKTNKPIITQEQKKRIEKKKEIKEKQINIESAKEAKEQVRNFIIERRKSLNLASYETNLFVNSIEQVTSKAQREIIPFIIEGTNIPKELNRPDLEKAYAKNKDDLKPIALQVKKHFDNGWLKMKQHIPDMSASQIENYVTHIWDLNKKQKKEITNWFITQNRFLKKRYIETLKEGIEKFGLKPRTLDIGDIIRIHDGVMNRAIENKKFVDDLMKLRKEGVPLIERADKAPQDWVLFDHPALRKALVIPGEAKMGEKISPKLKAILDDMGVAIGRRISPIAFGKPVRKQGEYRQGDPPEVRFQRFFSSRTAAHEIGHHLDNALGLGEEFLNDYKSELYAINRERIEASKGIKGKYGTEYTESTEEQIAEFFATLFTDADKAYNLAPNATIDALERLKQDGTLTKLIDFDFEKGAKNLIEEQLNMLIKLPVKVHPDLVKPLKVIFESRFDHSAIQAYEMVNGILKKTNLSISLFHHGALGETGVATMGIGRTTNIYFNPVKIYRAMVKGEFDIYKKEAVARKWIGAGLQVGATHDIPVNMIQEKLNGLSKKSKNIPIAKQVTEFIATFNEQWDKALWTYLHDTLKLYACESLGTKINAFKDVGKQMAEITQMVNDTFGGQNWDMLMVSPKTLQIMSWGLLSPDWTLSTIRQALSPTGIGAIHKETKGLRRKLGSYFWLKAGLYFGVGINLLNYTFRKWDEEKNPQYYKDQKLTFWDRTMIGNTIGKRTNLFVGRYADGTERYIRWGKQFRELLEFFFDSTGFSPIAASLKKVGGKIAPLMQLTSQIFTGVAPSGFRNDDIYGKKGWDKTFGIFKTLLKSPLPFASRSLLTKDKEFHITDVAFPSSKGMTRYRSVELFKHAIMKKDERFLKEVYQDTLKNNLPAFTLFNAAIVSLKAETTKELNVNRKTMDDIKIGLEKATKNGDVQDINRLNNRLMRMVKESMDRQNGIKAYGEAVNRMNQYNDKKRNLGLKSMGLK